MGGVEIIALLLLSFAATPLLLRWWTASRCRARIVASASAPPTKVAIVFGAGLRRDGTPTSVLRDRLETAADLYFAGTVEKLLLTGDNRTKDYNEPESMRRYAIGLGVPDAALALDYGGRSTYDSCYRARAIFGLTEAVLITQAFHLDRALYLCDSFGINAVGVAANRRVYSVRLERWWRLREVFATTVAWWNVNVARPLPVLDDPIPIG
ncbi:MAG: YdcF family protein [Chloroflexi bacterium]|nr:YdcF family protein [Chloroflexota bacterium]